ncbi:Phosphoheptose isomerase [Deinococcus saxicola]|uniref:D-sedoheptulose-7-phosphate isomerase n=1 Tax=Deinococcus saxicola TaxID=249406 RepID=UPI0039F1335A
MTTSIPTSELTQTQFRGALTRHRAALEHLNRLEPELIRAAELCIQTLQRGGKILVCGNGGSAADAQHFAAELTGHFRRERGPLSAVALTTDSSALTCIGNDYAFEDVFSRQVTSLARVGDTVVGISTSGRSPNVLRALQAAKEAQASTILLTGSKLASPPARADVTLAIAADRTAHIQEMHILLIHVLCETIDDAFLGQEEADA